MWLPDNLVKAMVPSFQVVVSAWSCGLVHIPNVDGKHSYNPSVLHVLNELIHVGNGWMTCFQTCHAILTSQAQRLELYTFGCTSLCLLGIQLAFLDSGLFAKSPVHMQW